MKVCQYRKRDMRLVKPVILLSLVISLLGGCFSRDSYLEDIKSTRREAYRQWLAEREEKRASEARIEGKLSVEDSIKLALKYNKNLYATLEEKEKARGQILESYGAALPSVSLESSYTRRSSLGKPASGFLDNYSSELQVTQPVFSGGAIPSALRAAKLYSLLADEQVRSEVQNVIFSTSKAYYDVLLAKELYRVNQVALGNSRKHLDRVKKERLAEKATDYDVLRAEVDVSNFEAVMIEQRNKLELAKLSLYKIMGVSQQSMVTTATELEYISMKPVLEQAVKLALENRPDLYQAELGVKLQEEAVRLAKSKYWPSMAGFFNYKVANPDPDEATATDAHTGDNWNAGVAASWNIFDGLAREGKLKQEKAELKKQHIKLLDAQESVLLQIQQSLLNIKDAEELVTSQKMNKKRAVEGLSQAQKGYDAQVLTELEVLDANTALTTAEGNYYSALYRHTLARLELQKAMGVLGPEPGRGDVPAESPVPPARADQFFGKGK